MFEPQHDQMNEELPQQVRNTFSAYRQALPDFDASPEFMPALWERIERHQKVTYSFRRVAGGLVTASAGLCFVVGLMLWAPQQHNGITGADNTYVEVLADEASDELTPELNTL
ncbi:MAG: hypothetical protein H7039_01260 [Bryobacteraceae bacterium]|nr:hypothetical protein [Bryobacteraceae bacterium]